jgi:hypothetical protein
MADWADGVMVLEQTGVGASVIDLFQQEGLEPVMRPSAGSMPWAMLDKVAKINPE